MEYKYWKRAGERQGMSGVDAGQNANWRQQSVEEAGSVYQQTTASLHIHLVKSITEFEDQELTRPIDSSTVAWKTVAYEIDSRYK